MTGETVRLDRKARKPAAIPKSARPDLTALLELWGDWIKHGGDTRAMLPAIGYPAQSPIHRIGEISSTGRQSSRAAITHGKATRARPEQRYGWIWFTSPPALEVEKQVARLNSSQRLVIARRYVHREGIGAWGHHSIVTLRTAERLIYQGLIGVG